MRNDNVKLFCIPFSGGNAYSYSEFRKYLPENIEFCPLELPGRGKRISEPLLRNIEDMTKDLVGQMENEISGRYAIFGHSLGALLGITVCRALLIKKLNCPLMLFLSGQIAPSLIKSDNNHNLPDDKFTDILRQMEGTPEELLSDKNFVSFFMPIVKADFKAISDYRYTPKNFPNDVPITVLLGSQDKISVEEASLWQVETDKIISIHHFEGGHFFIFNQMEQIVNLVVEKIKVVS